jgi:hypothetical protein
MAIRVCPPRHLKPGTVRNHCVVLNWIRQSKYAKSGQAVSIYHLACMKCGNIFESPSNKISCKKCTRYRAPIVKNLQVFPVVPAQAVVPAVQVTVETKPEVLPIVVEVPKKTTEQIETFWKAKIKILDRIDELSRNLSRAKEAYENSIKVDNQNLETNKTRLKWLEEEFNK